MEEVQCTKYAIKVKHRLTATHNNYAANHFAGSTQAFVKEVNLHDDFRSSKVTHATIQTTGTKSTMHIAANLTGNAYAVTVIVVHQNSFNRVTVRKSN